MLADQAPSTLFSPVILAPTFNNSTSLSEVLSRIEQLHLPVIVINDGSTDQTPAILERFDSIMVVNHPRNLGKAAALQTGFQAAEKMGYTHAVTIDTDGQHNPEQIPELLDAARQSPQALILGRRERQIAGYPWRSRLGRAISNGLVWLESGLRVDDTQCGLRVYPLELVARASCFASRYGYETEILTRAAWMGVGIVEVKVNCRYSQISGLVSHFRPLVDSLRAMVMHTRLIWRSAPRWPRRMASAIHPIAGWRHLRATPKARNEFAGGLALGVFFACLPLYGVQGVLSFITARLLRLNRLSAVAGSQISTPPLSAVLIAALLSLPTHILKRARSGPWMKSGKRRRP
jgi:glycosyltransferase involved in cell wall biosynthesis